MRCVHDKLDLQLGCVALCRREGDQMSRSRRGTVARMRSILAIPTATSDFENLILWVRGAVGSAVDS